MDNNVDQLKKKQVHNHRMYFYVETKFISALYQKNDQYFSKLWIQRSLCVSTTSEIGIQLEKRTLG